MKLPDLELFITVCEKTGGIVSSIADTFSVSRRTVYNWVNSNPDYKAALDDAREVILDLVESEMISQAKKGNTTILIFLAKTLGKHRGYVERQEFSIDKETHKMTEDEERALMKRYEKVLNGHAKDDQVRDGEAANKA